MDNSSDLVGIVVRLLVEGEQSLLILLGNDGSINRMGNGSVDHIEREMFIGRAMPELFTELRSRVTAGVVHFLGQRLAAPQPKGKLCELSVMFKYADMREVTSAWRYGSESQGPHPEVCDFVMAALQVTERWYQQEKQMVGRNIATT